MALNLLVSGWFGTHFSAHELEVARMLLVEKDPFGALYTLKRYRVLAPEAVSDPEFLFLEGLAYSYAHDFDQAEARFDQVRKLAPPNTRLYELALLEKAENSFFQGMMELAWQRYLSFSKEVRDPFLRSYSLYKAGWASLFLEDFEGAEYAFQEAGETLGIPLTSFTIHLQRIRDLPRKSPGLALALSLIPGLGQLYVGNLGDAASAFLVNLAFAGATYVLLRNHQNVLALLVGAVGLTWYGGNLYAAWDGANAFNQHGYNEAMEQFKREALLHYNPAHPQRLILWRYGVDFH